jgi:hypothetical protein
VGAVAFDPARDDDLRERLARQLEVRIRFVILEKDVKSRFVLLDEIRFEDERLDLVVDDDEFEINDRAHQPTSFRILIPARLEILPYTVPQILGFADVQDLAVGVLMQVNTGRYGQKLKFFFKVGHMKNLTLAARSNQNDVPRCSGVFDMSLALES